MTLGRILRFIVASRRGTLGGSRLDLVGVVPVAVPGQSIEIADRELEVPVTLDLFQVAALVAQQALVLLMSWQRVDRVPKAGPAGEPSPAHQPGQQAGGGADGHASTPSA